ncbi:MAG: putative DNA binding domain-containing protein [Anaerolineae bacterium]|nr:putative DNA binding domain-containing protein [Anaerolineae bacterium]
MVAFANASGGSLFLGITDDGRIDGVIDSNRLRSQIQDIANNCDPRVPIRIVPHGNVLEIAVPEGTDKPYRCNEGFFLRIGPNSQQLTRDEILRFAIKSDKVRFDEQYETKVNTEEFLDHDRVRAFAQQRGLPATTKADDVLTSLRIAEKQQNRLLLTRAALLFFGHDPQRLFPEAFVTCALYADETRATVLDRADFKGTLVEQFESAMGFIRRNLRVGYRINHAGPRREVAEIPEPVLREGLLNALTHRDYFADIEHIFVHMHSNRIEITNPGGLPYGLTIEELGTHAVPRNRLIADIFYRMGYVERLGSGIHRMYEAMIAAGLPAPRFLPTATAFQIELLKSFVDAGLSSEDAKVCEWLASHGPATIRDLMADLDVSKTTAHRRISKLIAEGWIEVLGSGKNTSYGLRRIRVFRGTEAERSTQ